MENSENIIDLIYSFSTYDSFASLRDDSIKETNQYKIFEYLNSLDGQKYDERQLKKYTRQNVDFISDALDRLDLFEYYKEIVSDNHFYSKETYGEITKEGVETIISKIKQYNTKEDLFFIDLGSGKGRLCLHLYAKTNYKKIVGIESNLTRFKESIRFQEMCQIESDRILFIHDNFLDFNLQKADVLFTNDAAFDVEITQSIWNKINTGSHLICHKKIKGEIPVEILKIQTSWAPEVEFNYYIKS